MKAKSVLAFLTSAFYWVFGVCTCAYYAAVTLNGCSQAPYLLALFSPLAIIPISNAILLAAGSRFVQPTRQTLPLLGGLSGVALIVSIILATVLSPLWILATVFGMVLVMVPPVSALCYFYVSVAIGPLVTSIAMRRKLKRLFPECKQTSWLPLSSCLAVVLTFILVGIFPVSLTQAGQQVVTTPSEVKKGLLLLRALGDDNTLLQACYGEQVHLPWFFQNAFLFGWFSNNMSPLLNNYLSETTAREIYYRAKGIPFNVVPRTRMKFIGAGGPFMLGEEMYDWDDDYYSYLDYYDHDFAGETVGGVVRGLSLNQSEIKGWVDPDEAIAHLTWNQHFKIDSGSGKEIRAQILLPPHAVITGCSLWIDGVKHDSVIATRSSSRTAYTTSAQRGEKPLLVSTAGAGRVLVQSSTGFWGKGAILSLDIIAPMTLLQNDKAALPLPMFTERNFSVNCEHQISLSVSPSSSTPISKSIKNIDLSNGVGTIIFTRNPSLTTLVAKDSADPKHDIVQRINAKDMTVEPVLIVVDGSAAMSDQINAIADSLQKLNSKDASILWASDTPLVIASHVSTDSPSWSAALSKLRDSSCLGGQNNAEALTFAIEQLATNNANIVWLHAGQPVKFSGDDLPRLLQRSPHKISIFEYQVVPGPNEVVKSLDQTNYLNQVPRVSSIQDDLKALFDRLTAKAPTYTLERTSVVPDAVSAPLAKHPVEVAQLYVSDLVFANAGNQPELVKYGTLAESHKLVTPLTSALVLDDKSSYEKYGVKTHTAGGKGQSSTNNASAAGKFGNMGSLAGLIPAKPEPPISLILACGLSIMGLFSWLKRRRRQHS